MPAEPSPSNIYACLYYDDAPVAIHFLCRAFGFERRLLVEGPNGTIAHAELALGPGVIMVGTSNPQKGWVSPRNASIVHVALCVQTDEPDAHYARAKAAGATILQELKDEDYGSRGYIARDPEGYQWCFASYRPGGWWNADGSENRVAHG